MPYNQLGSPRCSNSLDRPTDVFRQSVCRNADPNQAPCCYGCDVYSRDFFKLLFPCEFSKPRCWNEGTKLRLTVRLGLPRAQLPEKAVSVCIACCHHWQRRDKAEESCSLWSPAFVPGPRWLSRPLSYFSKQETEEASPWQRPRRELLVCGDVRGISLAPLKCYFPFPSRPDPAQEIIYSEVV